jgi:hypothetical protein
VRIVISENQYHRLINSNQTTFDNINEQSMGGGFSPQFQASQLSKVSKEGLSHEVSNVLQLVTAFMPVVGPIVSAGLGLMDANKYWKEGDKKSATIVTMFSLLPGLVNVVNKIPAIKRLGQQGMKNLAIKLSKLGNTIKPNKLEQEVLTGINKNKQLVNLELSKNKGKFNLQRTAQKSAKKVWDYQKRKINDTLEFIGRPKGGGVADVKNIKNPDEYVSLKMGHDKSGDFYYMSAKMSNPRDAGVAFKELKKAIPKGARFGEPAKGSLSTDSFYSMLRRTKEFTPKIVNYIKLNGDGTKRFQQFIKNNVEHNPNILKFKNFNDAKLLSTEINKEIQKNNIQTLSKIKKNENGLWEVLIPNIQLIMQ